MLWWSRIISYPVTFVRAGRSLIHPSVFSLLKKDELNSLWMTSPHRAALIWAYDSVILGKGKHLGTEEHKCVNWTYLHHLPLALLLYWFSDRLFSCCKLQSTSRISLKGTSPDCGHLLPPLWHLFTHLAEASWYGRQKTALEYALQLCCFWNPCHISLVTGLEHTPQIQVSY